MTAPEIISPGGKVAQDDLIISFRSGRKRIVSFVANTEAPLRSYSFPHPVFGDLDCYQWLLSSGAHYERHLAQICEVIEKSDFPVEHTSASAT
jgi:hypothetical protein